MTEEDDRMIEKAILKNFLVLDVGDRTLSQALIDLNKGIQLCKLFIILALIFLAAEVLIIRIWK